MENKRIVSVDVELTDSQILDAAAEIYLEDPTAFLGNIVAKASMLNSSTTGLDLNAV